MAANMRLVTSPDNRCHFILAHTTDDASTNGASASASASATGVGAGAGVSLDWCVDGRVV